MFELQTISSEYSKANLEIQISSETEEQVRDYDHLTGKHRGAVHNKCNSNCEQKRSNFIQCFFTTLVDM